MKTHSRFTIFFFISVILAILLIPSVGAQETTLERESVTIQNEHFVTNFTSISKNILDQMTDTFVDDVENIYLEQNPPSIPNLTTTTVTPKSHSYPDFTNYEAQENMSVWTNGVELLPTVEKGDLQWQNKSSSAFKRYYETTPSNDIIDIGWYNSTTIWEKNDAGSWHVNTTMLIDEKVQPIMDFYVVWEMNMTVHWKWNFGLNLHWYTAWANRTLGASAPYHLFYAYVQIKNHVTDSWDVLLDNLVYDVVYDHYFWLDYQKYVNPITKNITVQINGGEGQNSTWSHSNVWVDFAGAYTNQTPYRCENYTGYYLSEVVELPLESEYYWDKFEIDVANTSYKEGVDQIQPQWDALFGFGALAPSTISWGQTFTPMESDSVKFEVILSKSGSPADSVKLELYEAVGGMPVGLALAFDTIPASSITTNPTWSAFNFTIQYHFNLSREYAFVLTRTGALTALYEYWVAIKTANVYGGGMAFQDQGAGWNVEPTTDLYFMTYYFVDSPMVFAIRSSTDNQTWGGWSMTMHRHTDFSRHVYTRYVGTNLSRYMQFQINFSSNHPSYLPICFNVTFYYISYEWNYSIVEIDEFTFSDHWQKVYQVNVSLTFKVNPLPALAIIYFYNVVSLQWDLVSTSLVNQTWYIFGSNLTDYFNGSVYLKVYCENPLVPINLTKIKDVYFHYDYYVYSEIDRLDFGILYPDVIRLNSSFIMNDSYHFTHINLWNAVGENYDLVSSVGNLTNFLIASQYYNGSITLYIEIETFEPVTIDKSINITVWYYSNVIEFEEIDRFDFTVPLGDVYSVSLDLQLLTNVSFGLDSFALWNLFSESFDYMIRLGNLTNYGLMQNITVLNNLSTYYNGSLITHIQFQSVLSITPIPTLYVNKVVTMTISYLQVVPEADLLWLWITLGVAIPVGVAVGIYFWRFYPRQRFIATIG